MKKSSRKFTGLTTSKKRMSTLSKKSEKLAQSFIIKKNTMPILLVPPCLSMDYATEKTTNMS